MQLSSEEKERYSRQILIDKIGEKGQKKLKHSSVLIIGAGGLGNPVSIYLVASGLGKIGLVDADVVSVLNLGRQVLYTINDVGKKKVFLAQERLNKLNPNVKIDVYKERLSNLNASEIFLKYDVVVDATDNFETRYLINRTAIKTGKPLFVGAVGRFTGQVMSILPGKTACYNCVFPEKSPEIVHSMTDNNRLMGILGSLAGTIGSIVSTEVIKFFVDIGSKYFNKLLIYDALDNNFSILNIERDPRCKICGGE
ncbi:MAG: HesA/MoeB/ThiF family protein [Caldisericota bacterium]|nr:HesA/MoeB/ThiF family protein [Caldisericota bacterium]